MSNKTPTIILVAFIAVAAAAAGFWFAQLSNSPTTGNSEPTLIQIGPLLGLPEPKPLSEFALYDHLGNEFTRSELEGSWTLVFFGFASCPHICPNTLFKLTRVVDQLEEKLPSELVPRVLFVSVDPARDTAEVLNDYRERFGGDLLAASGSDAELRSLVMELGAHYVIPEHEPGEWYNVDHSISIHLLNPEVEWAGLFSAPHDIAEIAGSLETYIGDS